MKRAAVVAAVAVCIAALPVAPAGLDVRTAAAGDHRSVPTTLTADEWALFKHRFVTPDGRVVDMENGGISHSESQGYGMLLAVRADDRAAFDKIRDFTFRHMRARSDNLVSWIYDPRANPPVRDRNNASDGDIFIAYALVMAAIKWNERGYLAVAKPIIDDIGRLLLTERGGRTLVRPAAFGFDRGDHTDGPVINLSYYVYSAFPLFEAVASEYPFEAASQSGLSLTLDAVRASRGHAPDWVTLRNDRAFRPARGFAQRSSYDAVRIPLYMAMAGGVAPRYFAPFDRAWNLSGFRAPKDYDLVSRRTLMVMNDPGYRAIAALTACAARGAPIPAVLQRFEPTTYFASSLHLFALSAARVHYPECLPRNVAALPGDQVPAAPALSTAPTAPMTVVAGSREPAHTRHSFAGAVATRASGPGDLPHQRSHRGPQHRPTAQSHRRHFDM
ncbi:MAG: glycosyl hydrolase family 8 [Pseudomonadota bacterium]